MSAAPVVSGVQAVSKVEVFRALHHSRVPGDPLVLPGPWDAVSARVFADAGFPPT